MSLKEEFDQAEWGYNLQVGDQVVIMGMLPMTRKYSVTRVTDTHVVACTLRFSRETGEESPKPRGRNSYRIISESAWEEELKRRRAHNGEIWWRQWMMDQIVVFVKHCTDETIERFYKIMRSMMKEML